MAEYAVMPIADYRDACDAIREKDSSTGAIVSGEMGARIRAISGGLAASDPPVNLAHLSYLNTETTFYNGASEEFQFDAFPDCMIDGSFESSGLLCYGFMYVYDHTTNTRIAAGVYDKMICFGQKPDGGTSTTVTTGLGLLFSNMELNSYWQDMFGEYNILKIQNDSDRYAIQKMELLLYFPNGYEPHHW